MSTVADAEKVLADLELKRKSLIESRAAHDAERRNIAYAAHADGKKAARDKLSELADQAIHFETSLKSIDEAIAEAQSRLSAARAAAARAADRENALALREVLAEFIECGVSLSEALAAVAEEGHALHEAASKMRTLGCQYPSGEQIRVLGLQSIYTALQQTPWAREFRFIAPKDRRSFAALVRDWASRAEQTFVIPRLGEQTEESSEEAA